MSERADDATLEGSLPRGDGHTKTDDRPQSLVRGGAIGRYLVLSPIGAGAMGMVLAAYDPELDRKVAIKLLKPRGGALRRARERLQREAQALAKLGHPNVVTVYDVGVHEEQLFLAMELVEGQTLGAWMAAAPAVSTGGSPRAGTSPKAPVSARPWLEVLEVFAQAGRGLAAAHEAGLVHRDFKPDNVMLSRDGRVRVMDFGLARVDDDASQSVRTTDEVGSLTQTGALLGTPAYMPLEQFGGGPVDARSDQFSFCVALHEALYGERPFVGETIGELMGGLLEGVVRVPTRGAAVPGWVRAVVLRGLATKPEDRFPSMQALLAALAADPVARRRRIALRLGLGLALVASTWGVISLSGEVEERQATIEEREAVIGEQASELEQKNAALMWEVAEQKRLLSVQLGLRASALVGTENDAEALLLGVQAVGAYAYDWTAAPREAVMGLEQVLAHDAVNLEASHVLEGHEDYLVHMAYSPDGSQLATASYDGSVRVWDPVRAELRTTLDDHGGKNVLHVAFSPDGTRLATASKDAKARIWDARSGERLVTLEAPLHTLAFSPDGTQIATAGFERSVRVWNVRTGALLFTLASDDERMVHDLAYTPDGARLVTAGDDANAQVWDAKTGERLATLVGHEGPILAIAIAPDGTQVATASEDRSARLWALETGTLVATLEGHTNRVYKVAYSPDGTRVTTVSWDGTGRVYDPATGALVAVLEGGHGAGIATLAYAPDGASIATGSYGGNVSIWDAETGTLRARLRGHSADVWSMAFAPNGRQLATASVDHTARLWDLGEPWVAALEGPETNVREFAYSPTEAQLATMSLSGRVRLWARETGELLRTLDEGDEDEDVRGNPIYSPDGSQLVVASRGLLRTWDPRTGALLGTTRLGSQNSTVHYSPAGTLLRVYDETALQIFDARTLEPLATFEHAKDQKYSYSPDDSRVAITQEKPAVELWDPRTGALVGTLETPGDTISHVVYSPDGTELVTVGRQRGLRVWDAHRLTPRLTLQGSLGAWFVAYSPDGTRIAGGNGPEGVWIWSSRSGKVLLHIEPEALETGTGVAMFSPDGSRLVVIGSGTGFLRIHEVTEGKRLVYIDRSLAEHYELWPDGKRLTTLSSKHALEVWDIATGKPLTRERIGLVREEGSITGPIPPRELTRIGCRRLRVFARTYPQAREICEPLRGE